MESRNFAIGIDTSGCNMKGKTKIINGNVSLQNTIIYNVANIDSSGTTHIAIDLNIWIEKKFGMVLLVTKDCL